MPEIAPYFRSIHGPYGISCLKWVHTYINSKKRLRCNISEKSSTTREHGRSTRHHAGHCTHCLKDCMSGAHPYPDPLVGQTSTSSCISLSNPPRMAHFSPFLLPATKWITFSYDISPTNQFNELKRALLDQNASQGCQIFFPPTRSHGSKLLQSIWREELRLPLPNTTWAWTRPDHHP